MNVMLIKVVKISLYIKNKKIKINKSRKNLLVYFLAKSKFYKNTFYPGGYRIKMRQHCRTC